MEPSSVTITEESSKGNTEVESEDNTTLYITTDDPVDCNGSHCNHCTDDHSQTEPESAENNSAEPSSVTVTEESSKEVESEDNTRPIKHSNR